jgi:hypothetical protein
MSASLYVECWQEVAKHKWIESQKFGFDLGDRAIRDWFRRHWSIFCRAACLEHLAGIRPWIEFPDEDYGVLNDLRTAGDGGLLPWVLERAWRGRENLDMICEAQDSGLPMADVLQILELMNLNRARLDAPSDGPPQFAPPRTLRNPE